MAIELTSGQQEAADLLEKFLETDDPFFLLYGSAGVGKTFLLEEVKNNFKANPKYKGKEIIGCGPTHKSVEVLSTRLQDIECSTIHRFLGLRPKRTGNTTKLIRRNDYDPSANFSVAVVLLDEGSMCDTAIREYVEQDVADWGRKYIISGDSYQLNPVGEMTCAFFEKDYGPWRYELQQIVRQAEGNPIIKAATAIREAIKTKTQPDVLTGVNEGVGVHILRRQAWIDKLRESVKQTHPDAFRVLAWKNDTVRDYNQLVRVMSGKSSDVPFSVGEYVVVNEAYSRDEELILNTGMEFTIVEMEPMTHSVFENLQGWSVTLGMGDYLIPEKVNVLDYQTCGQAYKAQLNKFIEEAQVRGDWRAYYRLQESWCDLRPLHALTCHKSQGSTYDNVFIDYRDIYSNRIAAESDRSLYVGLTRARYNAYILI
jgi:exodeoxyribonuclease-5